MLQNFEITLSDIKPEKSNKVHLSIYNLKIDIIDNLKNCEH